MDLKKLHPFYRCKEYHIPLWQCPQFLFLVMGIIIIAVILSTYFITVKRIQDPMLVVLLVILVTLVLLIIDFIITRSFERMAEASRLKTEFISVVSHQLRSPLTNLKYTVEIVSEGNESPEKKREYFNILKDNIERMVDLINNLIVVSRIESGGIYLKKQGVSLADIVKQVVMKFKPRAEAANVRIVLNIEKNLPLVKGDRLWLEEVIENLVDNAIRYIKKNGLIKIRVRQVGRQVYFEIEDNGVGIPKEEQKYIFEKFFRSKNVLKYQTQGSGLGLYIAKQILRMLDGNIWFESKENRGSKFYVALPIDKKDKQTPEKKKTEIHEKKTEAPNFVSS